MKTLIVALLLSLASAILFENNLHVITHSHLDAGWVYSVDECYDVVENILDSVTESLVADKKRKYTIGDIYMFTRWYSHKNHT
jgi:hypothetical protein